MKKIIIVFALLLSYIASAQKDFFPGDSPEILIGKKVKIKSTIPIGLYNSTSLSSYISSSSKKYEKIKDAEFTVLSVSDVSDKKFLKLENKEIGKIYHGYNKNNPDEYELELIEEPNLPEDFFCKKIKVKEDLKYTPYRKDYSIFMYGSSMMSLDLKINDQKFYPNANGVVLVFEDGTSQDMKAEITHEVGNAKQGWIYNASIDLTDKEIELLKSKKIKIFKMHILNKRISAGSAVEILEFIKCLDKK